MVINRVEIRETDPSQKGPKMHIFGAKSRFSQPFRRKILHGEVLIVRHPPDLQGERSAFADERLNFFRENGVFAVRMLR
jgi:hypothetical protein